jgi:trehalose/maltose hydrolase-like predicted phosphorylase
VKQGTEWIKELLENENPWILNSKIEDNREHRDAFIGNGYIGQRIGPSGDGSDFKMGSASYMHGFWNDRNLMSLPSWANLRLHESDYGLSINWRSPIGCRKNYEQRLFLHEGKVETSYLHETNKLHSKVKLTSFLSRSERNLGVMRLEIESQRNNAVQAIECTIDAFHCDSGIEWRIEDTNELQILSGKMGDSQYPIQIVSYLEIEGGEFLKEENVQDGRRTSRILFFKLNSGKKLTITKYVSIRSREDGINLKADAINQVKSCIGQYENILKSHQESWANFWQQRIEVPDVAIQTIINASLYYFGANLREGVNWGLGPVGLAGRHWGGRVFWDADLWMHPVIAMLHPELGSCFTEYRIKTLNGMLINAEKEGRSGACVAWEAAETGEEKVSIPEIHEQRHVNADVVFMLRLQSFITGDEKWLKEKAMPLIRAIAEYWTKRVEWDQNKNAYVLLGIYCADENADIRDNNAHTNFVATWTLRIAYDLEKKFGGTPPDNWKTIADQMYMPWNESRKIWDEYEGWTGEDKIKQSDTTLMIYPYEKPMADDLKMRLNDYYTSCYESGKIMMGSAIDGVVDCELGRNEKGWQALMDMIPHFRPPFLCVSERPTNEIINFLTGLGGVLQLIAMGFAGIRIHDDALLVEPALPKNWPGMKIIGMQYKGNQFDLQIDGAKISVQIKKQGQPFKIVNRKGAVLFSNK